MAHSGDLYLADTVQDPLLGQFTALVRCQTVQEYMYLVLTVRVPLADLPPGAKAANVGEEELCEAAELWPRPAARIRSASGGHDAGLNKIVGN